MNEIINIENYNGKKLKNLQVVLYHCSNCGKEQLVQFRHYHINKLCPTCGRRKNNKSSNPEVIKKRKETCLKKYGKNYNKEIAKRQQESMIKKYGNKQTMLIPELKNKVISTQNEKYNGVGFSSKYIHDKTMKSGKEKNSYSKSSFWKNKSEDEIRDIVSKMNKRYVYNNITFDSSWELAFYIYNIDNGKEIKRENKIIKYIENNKEHKYIIDFTVENKN